MSQLRFFRIYKDKKLIDVRQFGDGQINIGSGTDVDVFLDSEHVSPVHAVVEQRNGESYLCDMGSETGTYINRESVLDTKLNSGDEIIVGPYKIEYYVGVPKPAKASPGSEEVTVSDIRISTQPKKQSSQSSSSNSRPSSPQMDPHGQVRGFTKPNLGNHSKHITYAPPDQISNIKTFVKPSKGNTVEVLVSWKNRVLSTQFFNHEGSYYIGTHPECEIYLPLFNSSQIKHPLLQLTRGAQIVLLSDMQGVIVKKDGELSFDELKKTGKVFNHQLGFTYNLQQDELVRIDLQDGLSIFIRYVGGTPVVLPSGLFSSSEMGALLIMILLSTLLSVFVLLHKVEKEEEEEKEPDRIAKFIFKKKEEIKLDKTFGAPDSKEKKRIELDMAKGKAAEAPKVVQNESQDKALVAKNKATGGGKPSEKQKEKDFSKSGLLSVFGTSGTNTKMNTAYEKAGAVGRMGKASGVVGPGSGSGDPGLLNAGKSGAGESSFGIAGVGTKGRGGGLSGYGEGTIGSKDSMGIVPGGDGESFTGTIDKEAIRRVIMANLSQIKACYDRVLNRQPDLAGKVIIQWGIASGGRVSYAKVKSSSLGSSQVENCMIARWKTWTFPEPPDDAEVDVSYPFVFSAKN